jgi:uncharacterized membrane-anchored protein YhcB (DUF1043 family)
MRDLSASSARKPKRWLLVTLVAFVVGVYVMTILVRLGGAGGG